VSYSDPELWMQLRSFGARLGLAALVLIGFWAAGALIPRIFGRFSARLGAGRQELLSLGTQVARVGLRIVGAITALGTVGVDVSALVAGLGLTGFALGFALKDALSNVLAGAMILFYRPFQAGSHITVSGYDGVVSQIDLRYTRLRTQAADVLLPNSTLLTNPITVHDATPPPPVATAT
jgi:small conductance mechanosensitive channel